MAINKHTLEKTGTVAVEGGDVAYRLYVPHDKIAAARTPLIVIHGGPGASHAALYDGLNKLADDRPVVFYDQLGSYFSPAAMTPHLMRTERFADELGQVMAALGIENAALLGHSWGGVIATEFALKHPERVTGLVLSSPLLSTPRWMTDCNDLLDKFPKEMREIVRRCEAEGTTDSPEYEAADNDFSARHYCRTVPLPGVIAAHKNKRNQHVYNTMWGPSEFTALGTLKDLDLFPRLHEIAAPAILICGEHDTATPAAMRDAAKLMQNAEVSVLKDCSHAAYLENNEAYLGEVSRFLSAAIDTPISRCKNPGISRPKGLPRPPGP